MLSNKRPLSHRSRLHVFPVVCANGIVLGGEQIVRLARLLSLALLVVYLGKKIQSVARSDIVVEVRRGKLVRKLLELCQGQIRPGRDASQVVPRTLILRRLTDGVLCESVDILVGMCWAGSVSSQLT